MTKYAGEAYEIQRKNEKVKQYMHIHRKQLLYACKNELSIVFFKFIFNFLKK
jgi:hypothetical protein